MDVRKVDVFSRSLLFGQHPINTERLLKEALLIIKASLPIPSGTDFSFMRIETAMAKTDQYSALLALLLCAGLAAGVNGALEVGYYDHSCPKAESTVFEVVRHAFLKSREVAPGLIRMHFHDCFVRGCDGSVLIDSTAKNTAEKDSPVNNPSLHGYDVIDTAKSRLEAICPNTVSCADILAFAARDSTKLASPHKHTLSWDVPAGRRDGLISLASEVVANIPAPTFNVTQLTQNFAAKGLSQEEMVILSGAHSIGVSHCTSFVSRLYNFSTTIPTDPSLDPMLADLLKKKCPQGSPSNNITTVFMDTSTPETIDNLYYNGLLKKHGLFTSDASLLTDRNTASVVDASAGRRHLRTWQERFAAAMVNMGMIIELTGNEGEIRRKCSVINSS